MGCGDSLSPKFFEVHNQDRFFSSNQYDPIPCLSVFMGTLSFCALGATHLENCNLPLSPSCLYPALLQKAVKSLPNVHERKHWNALLSRPFTNNSTAYKLFKSNLARVLRTSNHILVLAAMTIFGHIFPLLRATSLAFFFFSLICYTKFVLSHPKFLWKTWSFFPLDFLFQPTERKKGFLLQFLHLVFGHSLPSPPWLLSTPHATGVLPFDPQSKSSGSVLFTFGYQWENQNIKQKSYRFKATQLPIQRAGIWI